MPKERANFFLVEPRDTLVYPLLKTIKENFIMKKILLGTSTLVGAAVLFAGSAVADTPKVTVGGYANFQVGISDDDRNADQRPQAFRNDTIVAFKIDGKSDSGLGYGGEINILADVSGDVQGRGTNASKTMVYLENMYGRVELGSNIGAENSMKVDAATIARATGGINGDWTYFANANNQFLAQGALPLQYGALGNNAGGNGNNFVGQRTEENLNKVTYYTPRFAGFQVGVSYLPDQLNRGQGFSTQNVPGPNRADNINGLSQNIFTGGLSYDNKFGDIGVAAAVTGMAGESMTATHNDLEAWNAGLKLAYMGFTLAGGYGDWGDSNTLKTDASDDTNYWNVGLAYEYGPFGASATYLDSTFDCGNAGGTTGATGDCATAGNNDFESLSVGVDYKLVPGLTPYAEVTWYEMNAAGTTTDNDGYVAIVGTQLNF